MTKLLELCKMGLRVVYNQAGGLRKAIVVDYHEPPPTVTLSTGRELIGDSWDDEVPVVIEPEGD